MLLHVVATVFVAVFASVVFVVFVVFVVVATVVFAVFVAVTCFVKHQLPHVNQPGIRLDLRLPASPPPPEPLTRRKQ